MGKEEKPKKPMKKLNDKHKLFVTEYIKDLNATAAYLRAGYKANEETARRMASRLMTKDDIQQAIQEAQNRRLERVEWSADEILRDLKEIATNRNNELRERIRAYELGGRAASMFTDKINMKAEVGVNIINDVPKAN